MNGNTSLMRDDTSDESDSDSTLQRDFQVLNLSNSPSDHASYMELPPLLTRLSMEQVQGHVALAGSSFSFARVSSTSLVSSFDETNSPSGNSPLGGSPPQGSPKASAQAQILLHDEADGSYVQIIKQIGSGSFGRVFLGLLDGEQVAVKAMFEERRRSSTGVSEERKLMENRKNKMLKLEGMLMSLVSGHSNIVRTFKCLSTDPDPSRDLNIRKASNKEKRGSMTGRVKVQGPRGTVAYEWYIVMEYCARGTLWGHITRGKTHRQRKVTARTAYEAQIMKPDPKIDPDETLILIEWDSWACTEFLKEVARAICFLHDHDIIHADVKSDNVLLSDSDIDRRGVTAKLTDFGLSRILKSSESSAKSSRKINTKTYGTVTHQPPELLKFNILTKSADIYAFAIFAWELFTMKEAHGELSESEVILGVGAGSLRPLFPIDCPQSYVDLISRCWAQEPEERPTAAQLEEELERLQKELAPQGASDSWTLLSVYHVDPATSH